MITELFAKYQIGAIHTADIIDGKVTNQALCSSKSERFCRLFLPCATLLSSRFIRLCYLNTLVQTKFSSKIFL